MTFNINIILSIKKDKDHFWNQHHLLISSLFKFYERKKLLLRGSGKSPINLRTAAQRAWAAKTSSGVGSSCKDPRGGFLECCGPVPWAKYVAAYLRKVYSDKSSLVSGKSLLNWSYIKYTHFITQKVYKQLKYWQIPQMICSKNEVI